jgi:hypothetical protein
MLFDKRGNNGLNLAILHIANHMMKERDMYYFLSYGDKDTFVRPAPRMAPALMLILSDTPTTPWVWTTR